MFDLIDDCRRAARPWVESPRRRLRLELVAITLTLIPHGNNNNFRKVTLLVLMGVWVAISLGGPSRVDEATYLTLTALIFTIIGRQWGLEVSRIAPNIKLSEAENSTDEDDDER
jgi:hypothetical protein